MKVRIIKTGEILDVNSDRANYWIRCNVAEEIEAEKVAKTPVDKQAYKKEKLNKKAYKNR